MMRLFHRLILGMLSISVATHWVQADDCCGKTCQFKHITAFGDSYTDIGNAPARPESICPSSSSLSISITFRCPFIRRRCCCFFSPPVIIATSNLSFPFHPSIYNFPDTIFMIVQTKVSLDRISSFLRLDDLHSDVIKKLLRGSSDVVIEIADGNFSWELSASNPTLKDINFKACQGMRVAVCGTVGSGKSSLLSCILGEVPKISGTLKLCGTKAYVAQSPWIQSGKIEENILFGKEMDRERYERILEACSLKKDLEVLSFGDQTVIGERGINLSGGQKQRIQIA